MLDCLVAHWSIGYFPAFHAAYPVLPRMACWSAAGRLLNHSALSFRAGFRSRMPVMPSSAQVLVRGTLAHRQLWVTIPLARYHPVFVWRL